MPIQTQLPIDRELSYGPQRLRFCPVRIISRSEHSLIYAVKIEDNYSVLKWYKILNNDEYKSFLDNLFHRIINFESPHPSFLWPSSVCTKPTDTHHSSNQMFSGIGYFMRLKGKAFIDSTQYINGASGINPTNLIKACSNIAYAIACLHDKKMFHRDISLNNILIDSSNGNIQICDNEFIGLNQTQGSETIEPQIDRALKGTPGFIAPENLHHSQHSENTDNYSLAAVIYSLLTRTHIKNLGIFDHFPDIDPLEIPSDKKSDIKQLLYYALSINQNYSSQRPTARQWYELLKEK